MFAKKKIILNSAINDNKKGIAEITRLDNLTHLSVKIANFIPNTNSEFIFLVKNNGIQQKFLINNPKDFECEVDIPIDVNQKISCLLIENGQQPIFWGGTETQRATMNSIDTETQTKDNYSNFNSNRTAMNDTVKSNAFDMQEELPQLTNEQTITSGGCYGEETQVQAFDNNNFANYNYYDDYNCQISECWADFDESNQNALNEEICDAFHIDENLSDDANIEDMQPNAEALFDDGDLDCTIDESMKNFELIKNYEEHNFPQCANCKYKEIFFQQQQLQEAREELHKIAEIQKNETTNEDESHINSYNIASNEDNLFSNCNFEESQDAIKLNSNQEIQENELRQVYEQEVQVQEQKQKESQETTHEANSEAEEVEEVEAIENETPIEDSANDNDEENDKPPYYYSLIQNQYEEMFSKYPTFEILSNIIENSKWIMVDGIDDSYIMGIIYNGSRPQYLCYGVVQEHKQSPPIEIVGSSQWVPFNVNNEFGQGAYIMYQSAENGETLKVEVY